MKKFFKNNIKYFLLIVIYELVKNLIKFVIKKLNKKHKKEFKLIKKLKGLFK